ncbi:MAG: hypothetical protein IKQ61_13170 [Spirochaetales bacterium]|nr:hypothetical protein [Spirochaetales bacterium]
MGLTYADKRIQYIIYLDATYILCFLISMMSLIPEVETFQRCATVMLFSGGIYFVIRITQAFWQYDFFTSNQWIYYTSRIIFTLAIFFLHFTLMNTSILISGNLMISQKVVQTIHMSAEHVTFYIYDDDNTNYKTSVAIRQTILPTYKKILSEEILCQETLTIICEGGDFVISDGDYTFRYPCKYHRKHGYSSH